MQVKTTAAEALAGCGDKSDKGKTSDFKVFGWLREKLAGSGARSQ